MGVAHRWHTPHATQRVTKRAAELLRVAIGPECVCCATGAAGYPRTAAELLPLCCPHPPRVHIRTPPVFGRPRGHGGRCKTRPSHWEQPLIRMAQPKLNFYVERHSTLTALPRRWSFEPCSGAGQRYPSGAIARHAGHRASPSRCRLPRVWARGARKAKERGRIVESDRPPAIRWEGRPPVRGVWGEGRDGGVRACSRWAKLQPAW